MRYYIMDNHYNHYGIIKHDKRPFSSVEEMNEFMIEKHNKKVRPNDEVIFGGDFMLSNSIDEVESMLKRLNGKKYLVVGNHDRFVKDKNFDRSLFGWIKDYAELNDNNRKVIISHYPIMFYKGQYKGNNTYHLCGHVHDTQDNKLLEQFIKQTLEYKLENDKNIPCNIINCYAGFSNYEPLTLDEWIVLTNKRLKERNII